MKHSRIKRLKKIFSAFLLEPILGLFRSKVARSLVVVFVFCNVSVLLASPQPKVGIEVLRQLFEDAESIAIASASVIFFLEIPDRKKREQYEAWQVINSAQGQTGSGGRIQALEDLNKSRVDLEGVSAPGADLSGVNLAYGNIDRANLNKAQLDSSNLFMAGLNDANLSLANLNYANLRRASLTNADLSGASLIGADLSDSFLLSADLRDVQIGGANFKKAKLDRANLSQADCSNKHPKYKYKVPGNTNLSEASLDRTNLAGADLDDADLKGASLCKANLTNADLSETINLTKAQVSEAILCKTRLPKNLEIDPERLHKPNILKTTAAYQHIRDTSLSTISIALWPPFQRMN